MKPSLLIFMILIFGTISSGCSKVDEMAKISQITYTSDAGTILPELQWREEYRIFADRVVFFRTGSQVETQVNEGTWEIAAEKAKLAELFSSLEAANLKLIERNEPEEIPDGGGSASYLLTFSNGRSFSLDFTPGVTYQNGELITDPIMEFIQSLELPAEAAAQIK